MNEEKVITKNVEEISEKKSFITWVKEHKSQLLLAGISVTAVLATAVGLRNKDTLIDFWNTIKKEIEKGSLYSVKWFEKASLEDLEKARKSVKQDYNNPNLDLDYRNDCWNLLNRFDNAIGKIKWAGKEYGYPVHSDGGWYLPSDD